MKIFDSAQGGTISSWEEAQESENKLSVGLRVCGTFDGFYLVRSYMSLDSGKFWAQVRDLSCQ